MSRSAFIRTNRTLMRPMRRDPATLAKPASPASTVTPSSSVTPAAVGSNAKPSTQSRSTSSDCSASRAAALMKAGLTVPYCGPIAMATLDGASSPSRSVSRSPTACRYVPA